MRYGNWYKHDARRLVNARLQLEVSIDELENPATIAAFVERHRDRLSASEVVDLMTAANELVWQAFDFTGIGDWVDDAGVQRGRGADAAPRN